MKQKPSTAGPAASSQQGEAAGLRSRGIARSRCLACGDRDRGVDRAGPLAWSVRAAGSPSNMPSAFLACAPSLVALGAWLKPGEASGS